MFDVVSPLSVRLTCAPPSELPAGGCAVRVAEPATRRTEYAPDASAVIAELADQKELPTQLLEDALMVAPGSGLPPASVTRPLTRATGRLTSNTVPVPTARFPW